MNRVPRVGVTGGIGSGKSALTDRLQALGITIVDADVVARDVVERGSEALALIADRYGDTILLEDGSLDRAALRKIVFGDKNERLWLESLTHPRIGARIGELLAAAPPPYAVLSSPLLLEGSQRDFVDHIVVVDVPEAVQLARTCQRDGNSETLVKSIMAAQLSRAERLALADRIIDNSGDLAQLQQQAEALHTELLDMGQTVDDGSLRCAVARMGTSAGLHTDDGASRSVISASVLAPGSEKRVKNGLVRRRKGIAR